MKSRKLVCATGMALLTAVASPLGMLASQKEQAHLHEHHHYQLVDLGSTLGGPQSYFNPGSGNQFGEATLVINNRGTAVGFADTSAPDPFPNICIWDCSVVHAFRARSDGHMMDLGALPGGGSSIPTWINEKGMIAGVSENGEIDPLYAGLPQVRAVLWKHGQITDLGTLPGGGYQSAANAVNSKGQVVGAALNTIPDANSMQPSAFWLWGGIAPAYPYQTRAFLWEKDNGMQDLGTLPGGTDARAILINERGQVVGYSYTGSTPSTQCGAGFPLITGSFIWEKEKGMVDLGNFGGTCTLAYDLNNQGQIVGLSNLTGDQSVHAFLWEHGSLHDLGGSLGGDFTGAFALNDRGQSAGFAYLPGDAIFHAAFWNRAGELTDLRTVGNDQCSFATGINARGQIVGGSIPDCTVSFYNAFLWEDGSIFDLNALIPSGSALHLELTYTINDRGEIAGTGVDSSGNEHAFVLVPCDENHLGVEGCDYGLVTAAAAPSQEQRVVPRRTLSQPKGRRHPVPGRGIARVSSATELEAHHLDWQLEDAIAIREGAGSATEADVGASLPASANSCPIVRCSAHHTRPLVCGFGLCEHSFLPIYKAYDLTYRRACRFACGNP